MTWDLLVCDLDGTLVGKSEPLDPELVKAFHRARDRGLLISIATGRMPPGAERFRDELGITAPCIFYNGALVRDHEEGRDLFSLTLTRGLLARAYDVYANAPIHPLFYRDDRLYCLEETFPVREYADEQHLRVEPIPDPEEFLRLGGFVKSLFIGHPSTLPLVRTELEPVARPDARLVMTRTDYLEMIPAAASKGVALRHLCEHLGVPPDRVIAVGDQENDLEMLETAGLGVAMPDAPERVRTLADRVAPPRREGGLLALFRELMPQHFG